MCLTPTHTKTNEEKSTTDAPKQRVPAIVVKDDGQWNTILKTVKPETAKKTGEAIPMRF